MVRTKVASHHFDDLDVLRGLYYDPDSRHVWKDPLIVLRNFAFTRWFHHIATEEGPPPVPTKREALAAMCDLLEIRPIRDLAYMSQEELLELLRLEGNDFSLVPIREVYGLLGAAMVQKIQLAVEQGLEEEVLPDIRVPFLPD